MDKYFTISDKTKIYVGCLPNLKTGGTELVHQLVHVLNNVGCNAYVCFCYGDSSKAEHPAFAEYKCPYVMEIPAEEDTEDNILIVPETYTRMLYQYKHVQKAIWWLSVDFYFKNLTSGSNRAVIRLKNIAKRILNKQNFKFCSDKNEYVHLCQSQYAIDFVKSRGCQKTLYLSDYINQVYITSGEYSENGRKDNILYNPKKGVETTRKIMELYQKNYGYSCNWIALQGFTNDQIKTILSASKVYIDFGEHPGKDRFPREAAICKCCVITGKRGAAKYYEDIPIPDNYKYDDDAVDKIVSQIHKCVMEYQNCIGDFAHYRKFIGGEKASFEKSAVNIFGI